MIDRVKIWYYYNKTWVYNTQYIIYSILLLIFVIMVDFNYYDMRTYVPDFFLTTSSMARTILATLAAAQLTITTFTFSTILGVVTSYIINFSPRVIENFVSEKITMKVLGIFFGGFFYSIIALLLMRGFDDNHLVIAGFVAVVYSIASMIYFIIFVQKVISSLKVDNLLNNIYLKTLSAIKLELDKRVDYKPIFSKETRKSINVYPKGNGFVSLINYHKISTLLNGRNSEFVIDCRIGDYVNPEKVVGYITKAKSSQFDEEILHKISANIFLTDNKLYENDYRHGFDKIKDIAIRAMAPGMKYPNTAIRCINKIILLVMELSKVDSYHIVVKGDENNKIFYTGYTFEEDLVNALSNIINYGRDDIELMCAVFEGLETLSYSATPKNKQIVYKFAKDLYDNILSEPKGRFNKKRLDYIYNKVIKNYKVV